MTSFFLNIDSPEWDPVMPVMLPLGALNAIPFINASYGVLVPAIVFIFATFHHLNGKLAEEAETPSDNDYNNSRGPTTATREYV
jgi:hypothetical protein